MPELELEPVVEACSLPSSIAVAGDSDQPLSLQVSESSLESNEAVIIVSTALSPVEEIPTPTAVMDAQPEALSHSESLIDTTVYVEPEVPDPFLIDEEGDAMSEEEKGEDDGMERETSVAPSVASSELPAAQEIALNVSTMTLTAADTTSPAASEPPVHSPLSPLNLNKDVPPPPPEESENAVEEEEAPDLFLPGLINPTMLLPIPNVRRSFYSTNILLWWLPKSTSMYYMCTRRIR